MGNSLHSFSLLHNGNASNHVRLGTHATIDLIEKKAEEDGHHIEESTVRYTVDGLSCVLSLTRHLDKLGNVKKASVNLKDNICSGDHVFYCINVDTDPFQLTIVTKEGESSKYITIRGNITTETLTRSYVNRNKGGLLVLDSKDKRHINLNWTVTVAHYYANIIGNIAGTSKIDIGLSVIAKIRMSYTGILDITVEGPVQHPATALFYMFDEVQRTRIWKPTMCPHCANIVKRQRSGSMLWQSESEDSDSLHGPGHNPGSVLANAGKVWGNNNGNFKVGKLFLKGR